MVRFIGCVLALVGVWWVLMGPLFLGVVALGLAAIVFVLAQIRDAGKPASPAQMGQPLPVTKAPNEWKDNKGFLLVVGVVVVLVVASKYLR